MKKSHLPLFITIKDTQRITGLSYSSSKRKLSSIRKQFNKPPRMPVLRREFCSVMRFTDEDLHEYF